MWGGVLPEETPQSRFHPRKTEGGSPTGLCCHRTESRAEKMSGWKGRREVLKQRKPRGVRPGEGGAGGVLNPHDSSAELPARARDRLVVRKRQHLETKNFTGISAATHQTDRMWGSIPSNLTASNQRIFSSGEHN